MTPAQLTDWLAISSWIRAQRRPAEIEAAVQRFDDAIEPAQSPEPEVHVYPSNVEAD